MKVTRCSVEGCERDASRREWCNAHYRRLLRRGLLPPIIAVTGCTVDGCDRKHQAFGLCNVHYQRMLRVGATDLTFAPKSVCSVENCDRGAPIVSGLCVLHRQRMRRIGTTELPTVEELFWSHVVTMPNGCMEWTGATDPKGYGHGTVNGGHFAAHRRAWELANGPIPNGLHVCHHCDNPPCCNPEHLFLGTMKDNMMDMVSKGRSWQQRKTHCPQGHEYAGENLYVLPAGGRACRTCAREKNAAKYLKQRGETLTR